MSEKLRAYFYLHLCVFIWGFTAILGKMITLKALPLVWWRLLLCCLALFFIVPMAQMRSIARPRVFKMLGIGMVVGVHWLCFYGAIKLSNASVAVTSMAMTSFFAALVEPLMLRKKIQWFELALGILILPGMALVVGSIDWSMRTGFVVGLVGALLAAVFTTLNKEIVDRDPPPALTMSLVELSGGLIITSVALPFFMWISPEEAVWPHGTDWFLLPVLAWLCTLVPYSLSLKTLRHISAFATNLTINLEPVYGVVLAIILLREDKDLSPRFYLGVAIILIAVFSHPFLKKMEEKKRPNHVA
jgi:drug/metabolite transporter (DMT)-like permease